MWVLGGTCVSLTTSCYHSVSFVVVALSSLRARLVFLLQSMSIGCFSGSCVEIIFRLFFTENKMKQRRTVGESAKSVREQVFMWRYKSEPSIVESSVSKSSACCRYCQSCPWSVAKNLFFLDFFYFFLKKKKRCIWVYLCVCLLPWVRLFRDGCYLCVCLLP